MGNCINIPSAKKVKALVFNGVEKEFRARTRVEEITSGPYKGYDVVNDSHLQLPLPPEAKLRSDEVYYLIPRKRHHCKGSPILVNRGQKVKIVVTKQQLELLAKSANEFLSRIAIQALKKRGYQKWQPSLATIPEL